MIHGNMLCYTEILLDCKGSGIRVLLSGPTGLRHEVAKICSSAYGDNLKFHLKRPELQCMNLNLKLCHYCKRPCSIMKLKVHVLVLSVFTCVHSSEPM